MQYRIGYIGFGAMGGDYHYKAALREDVPFTPTAVFDIREEIRSDAVNKGLKVFDNLQDFLDSRLFDVVLVATPNQYHCEYSCSAMEAGYHVICEKPVAMNVAEVEKMIATSQRTGKLFSIHHNRRWDTDCQLMKQALESGLLGKLFTIENRVHMPGIGMMFEWRLFEDHGGGFLGDWGIHMLDQLLYVITEPVKSVWANLVKIQSPAGEDYSKILIRFESGLVAQVEASNCTAIPFPKWHASGTTGSVEIEKVYSTSGKLKYFEKGTDRERTAVIYPNHTVSNRSFNERPGSEYKEIELPLTPVPQDWALYYQNIAGVLDGTEELVVTPESVLRCFKVLEAARKSSETGQVVEF